MKLTLILTLLVFSSFALAQNQEQIILVNKNKFAEIKKEKNNAILAASLSSFYLSDKLKTKATNYSNVAAAKLKANEKIVPPKLRDGVAIDKNIKTVVYQDEVLAAKLSKQVAKGKLASKVFTGAFILSALITVEETLSNVRLLSGQAAKNSVLRLGGGGQTYIPLDELPLPPEEAKLFETEGYVKLSDELANELGFNNDDRLTTSETEKDSPRKSSTKPSAGSKKQ